MSDEPRIPDVAHWLEGWRAWRATSKHGLRSIGQDYVWPARQAAHAECAHQAQLCGMLLGYDDPGSASAAMRQMSTAGVILQFPPPRSALKAALAEHGPAPGQSCTCGLYARSTPPPWEDLPGHGHGFVVGRVALWGKVIRGATGMRAEYAYPLSLSDRRLAKRYGVPYERVRGRSRTSWGLRGVMVVNAVLVALSPLWDDWTTTGQIMRWWVSVVAVGTAAWVSWRD